MMTLNDINMESKEGRLLFAILGDVTSRKDGNGKPDETWNPNDALKHYEKIAEDIFSR